ncbi:MAG TPA: TIGR03435 family protein [Bryobacteraceae bacterium]|jgi:uncharacterized protein (TIGR03435 family)|nr:TIGR03435 family protein [Bryobacteraceae bacterium]
MLRASLLALLPVIAVGQSTPPPAFEVASIKLHEGRYNRIEVTTSGLRLTAYAANKGMLAMYAYRLKTFQLAGVTDDNTRWDIVAKAGGEAIPTTEEFRQMLRQLLADRFHLKVHREIHEMAIYALVVDKNGPKLQDADPTADSAGSFNQQGRNLVVTLTKASMSDVADAIGNAFLDRPIVDKTGLTGSYDVKFAYTPATGRNRESAPDLGDLDVFQSVRTLGLKLEPRRDPVEVLVIDRVEKPSEN